MEVLDSAVDHMMVVMLATAPRTVQADTRAVAILAVVIAAVADTATDVKVVNLIGV